MPQVETAGIATSYRDTGGAGTPVVLLHAFPLSSAMWDPQIEALGDRFRIIAPDLKGFGDSSAPDDPTAYTMDAYADEVKGVIDDLGLERVTLGGLSMGGYVAFAFLRKYPETVSALILADTRAEADPPEGIDKRTAQQDLVRREGTGGLIETLAGALLGEPTRAKKPDVVEAATRLMDQPPAGFVGGLEAMKTRVDSTGDLSFIRMPTLVIVGENDGVTPPEAARKLHEHIGGSRLVVIPEAGHLSSLEAPEAFNGALAEFLGDL